MSPAASMAIDGQTITFTGDLVKSTIRTLRQNEELLTSGESYQLQMDPNSRVDSAGLAYVANLVSMHNQTGGKISISNIPDSMQGLINLAQLDFIIK